MESRPASCFREKGLWALKRSGARRWRPIRIAGTARLGSPAPLRQAVARLPAFVMLCAAESTTLAIVVIGPEEAYSVQHQTRTPSKAPPKP